MRENPIQPIGLNVEGANDQNVLYLGYVPLVLRFPKNFIETEPKISALALVVPDLHVNCDLPVLIGTNALDMLYDKHRQGRRPKDLSHVYGYRQILHMLKLRKEVSSTGRVFLMTLKSRVRQVIPAEGRILLEGFVKASASGECAIVEQLTTCALPGGILVESCLVTLPKQHPYKLPVWVTNASGHDINLPSDCVIAELHTLMDIHGNLSSTDQKADAVKCCIMTQSASEHIKSDLTFDFGDSPLSKEWKDRVTENLRAYADVFAQHDLDSGHAIKVKHHINLKDETPFK